MPTGGIEPGDVASCRDCSQIQSRPVPGIENPSDCIEVEDPVPCLGRTHRLTYWGDYSVCTDQGSKRKTKKAEKQFRSRDCSPIRRSTSISCRSLNVLLTQFHNQDWQHDQYPQEGPKQICAPPPQDSYSLRSYSTCSHEEH